MKNNMTASSNDCKKQTIANNNNMSLHKIIKLFTCISLYRLLNAYIIRTQFDPDEYWQTLEPAYCLVFGDSNISSSNSDTSPIQSSIKSEDSKYGCALTWEWTRRYTPLDQDDETIINIQSTSIKQQIENMLLQAIHGPVRSYISILPTYWYYLTCRSLFEWAYFDSTTNSSDDILINNEVDTNKYTIINHVLHSYYTSLRQYVKKRIQRYSTYMISKGPMYIHALLVAAPTDLCVWLIATYISSNLQQHSSTTASSNNQTIPSSSWPFWSLVCSLTSWFHGYALIRTYANSVETVCLLFGIVLLSSELFGQYSADSKVGHHTRLQAKVAFIVGGLSACIRFTSLAAWVPMGLIISYRSGICDNTNNDKNKKKKNKKYSYRDMIHKLFGLCVTYGLLGVILGCCIDRYFYGFWAIPFLGNIHFNVLLGHGSLYGTYPLLWYVYAGIPTICGIMLPFFLWAVGTTLFRGSTSPSRQRILGIILPYIILHSFSAHKEFRFLLPILPLICILAGHAISELIVVAKTSKNGLLRRVLPKLILTGLILLNYPHLLYLGTIHQRGPIAVNRYIACSIIEAAQKIGGGQQYSVHYLMGCHSTPLYSHLHIPNVSTRTWHLDCSPDCRSSSVLVCESDVFSNNPLEFVKSAYGLNLVDSSCIEDNSSVDGSCVNKEKAVNVTEVPSYIVIMEDDALKVKEVLTKDMQLSHEANIRHTIKSLTWHDPSSRDIDTVVTIFSLIDIHFDHMVVYKQI